VDQVAVVLTVNLLVALAVAELLLSVLSHQIADPVQ
jgi:hypothetical protein